METGKKMMGRKEIAELYGVSYSTIVAWVKAGMPEYRPAGGWPMYDPDEVDAWVRSQKKEG